METFIKENPYFTSSRLRSLYSDFGNLKLLNPEGYEANIIAWESLLGDFVKSKYNNDSSISIDVKQAERLMSLLGFGSPKGLRVVFEELTKRKVVIPYSKYKSSRGFFYESEGIKDYISLNSWISWLGEKIELASTYGRDRNEDWKRDRYIFLHILQSKGLHYLQMLEEKLKDNSYGKIFDKRGFFEFLVGEIDGNLTDVDLECLFIYYCVVKACVTRTVDDRVYVKLRETSEQKGNIEEISNQDIQIIDMKVMLRKVRRRTKEIEDKYNSISGKLQDVCPGSKSIDENYRLKTLKLLQLKKQITKTYENTLNTLFNLEAVELKVNEASSNKEMYACFAKSSNILETLNKEIDIGELEDTKIKVEEQIDHTNVVSSSLSDNLRSENEDIEEEFNKLYKEEVQREKSHAKKMVSVRSLQNDEVKSDLLHKLDNLNINENNSQEINSEHEPNQEKLSINI